MEPTDRFLSREQKIDLGSEDSGKFFQSMASFVGFSEEDAAAIRQTSLVLEKHLPNIVASFYTHLLSYPPTRQHFLDREGKVDQNYLALRMHHLTNFWRKTAGGVYDNEYARYVDYVGRAHTSRGADPRIYIAERYVIGQVGFMQHAISAAITRELHEMDPDLEVHAIRAWNLLMMIILEMLSRAYSDEHTPDALHLPGQVNDQAVRDLAVDTYESGLGLQRPVEQLDVEIGPASEIPDGSRKLVQAHGLSIGVFHHKGKWYALRNSCLHRSGPVCEGTLQGDVLTCPWHGFQYDVTDGHLLVDPSARLATYPLHIEEGILHLRVPAQSEQKYDLSIQDAASLGLPAQTAAATGEETGGHFLAEEIPPGGMKLVSHHGQPVAIYNVTGVYYATQDACTHAGGPMHEGKLEGTAATCPWHGSCFDIRDGRVLRGPAQEPLKTFQVIIENGRGKIV